MLGQIKACGWVMLGFRGERCWVQGPEGSDADNTKWVLMARESGAEASEWVIQECWIMDVVGKWSWRHKVSDAKNMGLMSDAGDMVWEWMMLEQEVSNAVSRKWARVIMEPNNNEWCWVQWQSDVGWWSKWCWGHYMSDAGHRFREWMILRQEVANTTDRGWVILRQSMSDAGGSGWMMLGAEGVGCSSTGAWCGW